MAHWGKCDFKQLERLNKQLGKLVDVEFDAFCRQSANEIVSLLYAKVIKRTPVGEPPQFDGPLTTKVQGEPRLVQSITKNGETVFRKQKGKTHSILTKNGAIKQKYWSGYEGGTLRDAWAVMPVGHRGNHYTVVLLNPIKYAPYVEYGHRQKPGRYVPALGKQLKAHWVKGRFMLTISTQEVEQQAPAILEKKLYQFLKGCFDAK